VRGPVRTEDLSFTVPNVVVVVVAVVVVDEKPSDARVAVHVHDHVSVHDRVAPKCKNGLIGPALRARLPSISEAGIA
jgi:hypothetical protein